MQLGFDRLIRAIDEVAPDLPLPVVAQTGKGTYQARNIQTLESIAPSEFDGMIKQTHLLVAHAGIGTVLTAQRFGKPLVLFPRRASFGEHRNDHQLATVGQLDGRLGIIVAREESELRDAILRGLAMEMSGVADETAARRANLTSAIDQFIRTGIL
ncbi:MAG: glycosyltransferase [Novosphingobium sp.]|nr:glycosyltransferase [Novosphingobium sp.]